MLKSARWVWGIVCVLVIVPLVGGMGGCVDQWVKTDVPREVQKGLGVPARVPLSEARALADEWRDMQADAAKKAAADEAARREEARKLVAATVAEIEDQAARMEADGAAFARASTRKLAAMEADEQARVRLADAELARLREAAQATDRRLAASIAAAEAQAAQFGGLIGEGVGLAQGAASTLPGGSLLVPIIALLGGLFIRKPGDGKKIEAAEHKADAAEKKIDSEWEHGYRAGLLADPNRAINSTTLPTVNVKS